MIDHYLRDLSSSAIVVYVALSRYRNAHGVCYPSISTLEKVTGLVRKTVVRALHELIESELIEKRTRKSSNGGYDQNEYRFLSVHTERGGDGVDNTLGGGTSTL